MLLLVTGMLLGACASLRDGTAEPWPTNLPPMAYFKNAYARDPALLPEQSLEEYLYWVRKFYAGTTLYPRGWNDISEDLLAAAAGEAEIRERKHKLFVLGRGIAAEWSKANNIRLIDEGHLSVWGVAAGRAVNEGNVDATLDFILSDLEKVLDEELPPEAITADRYHEPDPDDWFAF